MTNLGRQVQEGTVELEIQLHPFDVSQNLCMCHRTWQQVTASIGSLRVPQD